MSDPYDVLCEDPVLDRLADEHGDLSVAPHDDPFRRVVESIVNQQLSTQSAAAIRDRLFEQVEVTPDGILAADEDVLADAGLSGQKIRYVRNAAERWDDTLDPSLYEDATNDEVVASVTDVTGFGDWTAKIYLMFVLGRADVFPVEDLGIRKAMAKHYGHEDREEMRAHAEAWRPYRTVACRHLWRTVN